MQGNVLRHGALEILSEAEVVDTREAIAISNVEDRRLLAQCSNDNICPYCYGHRFVETWFPMYRIHYFTDPCVRSCTTVHLAEWSSDRCPRP